MGHYDYYDLDERAEDLAHKIVKRYKGYGISIDIKDKSIIILKDRFKFGIKLRTGTRVDDIKKYEKDIRMSLKLSLFQVIEENLSIFIVAAKEFALNNSLRRILASPEFAEVKANKKIRIPHLVGFDATGKPVIVDLTKYPHIMASGTTGAGKTIGLKNLLLSVILSCSPNKARLLICDKAAEFEQFAEIPHLSHPIITDSNTFLKVMLILKGELDRRLSIKNSKEFPHLPTIVCVADEFLSFISEIRDKKRRNLAAETISAILRRGRHVKINLALGAHNPTQKNMLIDLSDIPARMAFRSAKYTNSITILGEGGAEKLRGDGDMLFRPSSNDGLKRIQGAFISSKNIKAVLNQVRFEYDNRSQSEIDYDRFLNSKYDFVINEEDLQEAEVNEEDSQTGNSRPTDREIDNKLFAEIIVWALDQELISCNFIMDTFHIGWKRASGFLEILHELGIAGDMYAKLPRAVLPACLEDLSPRIVGFLKRHGYTPDQIEKIFNSKGGKRA